MTFLRVVPKRLISVCSIMLLSHSPAIASDFACEASDDFRINLDESTIGEGTSLDQILDSFEHDVNELEESSDFPETCTFWGCEETTNPATLSFVKGKVLKGKESGKSEGWSFTTEGIVETDNCKERHNASVTYFMENFGIDYTEFCTNGCPNGLTCTPYGIELSSQSPGKSSLDFKVAKHGFWKKKYHASHSGGKEGEPAWFYVEGGCICCDMS